MSVASELRSVAGATLESRLARGPLPLEDALEVGRAVLGALAALHEQGRVHGDVRPANVLVGERRGAGGALGRPAIAHLAPARADSALEERGVESARYASPEQAGSIEGGVDARSDLYSAGALIHACLAGRPPFDAPDLGGLLRQHLNEPAPDPRALRPEVPGALADVVARLLRKDPRDRYQSARAAAWDLDEIAAALERGEADPPLVAGRRDRRATLTEPSFVGRASELSLLRGAVEAARAGRGGVTLLEADSGAGKSRVLDEAARDAARRGCAVFRGGASDGGAGAPFETLAGVARGPR